MIAMPRPFYECSDCGERYGLHEIHVCPPAGEWSAARVALVIVAAACAAIVWAVRSGRL